MIYRRKKYLVDASILEEFNTHFNNTLLPTQGKYGARLVGRWMTPKNDGIVEILAIWEYDSHQDYERIEMDVRSDIEHVGRVRDWYSKMGGKENLFHQTEQDFMELTVPIENTIISQ